MPQLEYLDGVPLSPLFSRQVQRSVSMLSASPSQRMYQSPGIPRSNSSVSHCASPRGVRRSPSIAMDSKLGLIKRISKLEQSEGPPLPPKSWRERKQRPLSVQFDLSPQDESSSRSRADSVMALSRSESVIVTSSRPRANTAMPGGICKPRGILTNHNGTVKQSRRLSLVDAVKTLEKQPWDQCTYAEPSLTPLIPPTPVLPPRPANTSARQSSVVIDFTIELTDKPTGVPNNGRNNVCTVIVNSKCSSVNGYLVDNRQHKERHQDSVPSPAIIPNSEFAVDTLNDEQDHYYADDSNDTSYEPDADFYHDNYHDNHIYSETSDNINISNEYLEPTFYQSDYHNSYHSSGNSYETLENRSNNSDLISASDICGTSDDGHPSDNYCVVYSRQSGINVYRKNSHGQTALDIVNKFTPTRAASDIKQMLRGKYFT